MLPSIAKVVDVLVVEVEDEELELEDAVVDVLAVVLVDLVVDVLLDVLVVVVVVDEGLMTSAITAKSLPWAVPNDSVAPEIGLVSTSY